MKTWIKVIASATFAVAAFAGGAAAWYRFALPRAAAPRATAVAVTPDRLARGKYIFEAVAYCDGCHGDRDFSRYAGPVRAGRHGAGNVVPEPTLPGRIVAPNITPDRETGIGAWSDGEKIRAIREGIGRDGRALFPMMPYAYYREMSDYDVESLVAYLNSLPPVKNPLPRTEVAFPVNYLMRSAPRPAGNVRAPEPGATAQYGAYLARLAHCVECHTPADKGQLDDSMRFAGGRTFNFPGVTVVSANITPDPDTGIGRWSEEYFLQRFTLHRGMAEHGPPPATPGQFTLMPWLGFARMSDSDLSAIYRFLQTQATVPNKVEKHPGQLRASSH